MRPNPLVVAVVFASVALGAQAPTLPSGWTARLDDPAAPVRVEPSHGGLHVMAGPAGIYYYRNSTAAAGGFDATAVFSSPRTIDGQPALSGAYGLMIGGADLTGASPHYTAFLIRPTGEFSIVRHAGADVRTVVDWQKNIAILGANEPAPKDKGASAQARPRGRALENDLEIDATREDVRLLINGAEVASVKSSDVDLDGIVGVRVEADSDVTFGPPSVKSRH